MKRLVGSLVAIFAFGALTVVSQETAVGVGDDTGGVFVPVSPVRVVNATTWTGGTGSFGAGESRSYTVAGSFGVPSTGASAVVLNLAAYGTTATTSSYLTAWATGQTRPIVSSLYYTHDNVPRSNTVIVPLGTGGKISLYNYTGTTNVIADIQGYFTASSSDTSAGGFVPLDVPSRVANTNTGQNVTAGTIPVGGNRDIQVTGIGGIASTATSVFANIEVSSATVNGTLRVGPGGTTLTGTAALSYGTDGRYDTGVSIKLNGTGAMRINNVTGSPVNFKIDVQGYFSGDPDEGGSFTPMTPTNVYSTTQAGEVDLQSEETRIIPIAGVGGLPGVPTLGAAVLTVQVKNWTAGGTVTAYPADIEWPGTSNVGFNYNEGNPANGLSSTAIIGVDYDGNIALYNTSSQPVRVTLTAQGWFSSTVLAQPPGPTADPVAPTTTIYPNVDNYELQDAAAVAEVEGRSVAAVAAEVGRANLIDAAIEQIETDNPGTFSYADYGDSTTDPKVVFKGSTVPASAAATLAALPVQVDAVAGAVYSATDMGAVSDIVRDELIEKYGDDASIAVETGPNASVLAQFYDTVPTPPAPTTTQTTTSARARVAAQRPSVTLPGVDIEQLSEPAATPSHNNIIGGQYISAAVGSPYWCTSGFPAQETTGAKYTGMFTAAHCHNNIQWNNSNIAETAERTLHPTTYVLRHPDDDANTYRWGDIEYHRAAYANLVKPIFMATLYESRPFKAVDIPRVRRYCLFGRTTAGSYAGKPTCAKTKPTKTSVNYAAKAPTHGAMAVSNLVMFNRFIARPGDSGGPVYFGTTGVGLVSGYKPCSKGSKKRCTIFSPLRIVPRAGYFDVRPFTE